MARNYFVDAAKGVSIILVVAHHSYLSHWFGSFLSGLTMVRLPLFFFLAGIFFKYTDSPNVFLSKKMSALLKPYFIFALALALLLPFIGKGDPLSNVYGVAYGTDTTYMTIGVLWFLPHLFTVYCGAYLILNKTPLLELGAKGIVLLIAAFGLGLFTLNDAASMELDALRDAGLPFGIDLLPLSLPLFLLGHVTKHYTIEFKPYIPAAIATGAIFLLCALQSGSLNFYSRIVNQHELVLLGSFTGIYFMLSIIYCLCKIHVIEKFLVAIGRQSLFILLFHMCFLSLVRDRLPLIDSESLAIAMTFLSFIIAVLIPVFAGQIIRKLPVLRLFFLPKAVQ